MACPGLARLTRPALATTTSTPSVSLIGGPFLPHLHLPYRHRLPVRRRAPAWMQGADGKFDYKLGKLQWSREKSIESVLVYLRQLLAKGEYKKLPQPADGTTYN